MREEGGLWKIIFLAITLPLLFLEFKYGLFKNFPRSALLVSLISLNLLDGVSTKYFIGRLGVEYEDNKMARWILMRSPFFGYWILKAIICSAFLVIIAKHFPVSFSFGFGAALLVATVNNFYFGAVGKQKIPLTNYEKYEKRP